VELLSLFFEVLIGAILGAPEKIVERFGKLGCLVILIVLTFIIALIFML